MADNVAVTPGSGATIATDDVGGAQYQRVKLDLGADGSGSPLVRGQQTQANSLPVTLAIVRSLIVEIDQERFALPLAHVAETVRAEPETIREINHRGVTQWRGDLIHVADGGAVLGTARARAPRRYYVVMAAGSKRRGLLVDRLVGHQDVVVKGLDPALGRPDVVSGTTILGDGRVACIVDAVRILEGGRRAG